MLLIFMYFSKKENKYFVKKKKKKLVLCKVQYFRILMIDFQQYFSEYLKIMINTECFQYLPT